MQPETAREVEIARAAYIRGMQDERSAWRDRYLRRQRLPLQYPDNLLAAQMYPMPAEVTP